MTTDTATLIAALRALAMIAADNHSANAAIVEAAQRLDEQAFRIEQLESAIATMRLVGERALNHE